jgi:hypothetical protein
MNGSRERRWIFRLLLTLVLVGASGATCEKQDKVVVQNIDPNAVNQPPTIVAFGPEMPAGGFSEISYSRIGIDLWVLVGDANGLGDISLVTMDMDSLRLVRFIVRPDTSAESCISYGYGPGDTLASDAILPVPAAFPGLKFRPLAHVQGGLYKAARLGAEFGFPDIVDASPVLEPWNGGCTSAGAYDVYGPFYVLPPAAPSRREAAISYAQLEYYGIKLTVYDKVGASASVTYPTLRITFKIPMESTPL